jgi:hypothetical protein
MAAARQGAEATLLERTDMLLGTGLVGGIFRNNGRFAASEELIALGGGDLIEAMDSNTLHRDMEFPGHRHASLYNVATMEPIVCRALWDAGVDVKLMTRFAKVETEGQRITAVIAKRHGKDVRFAGRVFIDATGTAGPRTLCKKHGNGCTMCVLRCPTFGPRVSVAGQAGIDEMTGQKKGRLGAVSGACKLLKESLSPDIVARLNETGVAVVALPKTDQFDADMSYKACQQYASAEYRDNIVFLDTGHAKLMTPFFPLDALRRVPGFENARYEDPYSGGEGNAIRYFDMSPRDDALKVTGLDNLYCAGEKAGLLVGHTEAICTGVLAGYNAARQALGHEPLVLPDSLAIGDSISFVRQRMATEEGLGLKYTYSGSVLFERMIERGTDTTDVNAVKSRVAQTGLSGVFADAPDAARQPAVPHGEESIAATAGRGN